MRPKLTPADLKADEEYRRTKQRYLEAGRAGKLQWSGYYSPGATVKESDWRTVYQHEVEGMLASHRLETFRVRP